jgi:hypothetical protein
MVDRKPVDEPQHKARIRCHQTSVKGHDLVLTRFARVETDLDVGD